MITRLLFRLLPMQILIAAIGAVNGVVSGLFASNFVGGESLSAVGLYNPITVFLSAVGLLLIGGSQILCGQFLGKHQVQRTRDIFSLDIAVTAFVAIFMTSIMAIGAFFDLTGIFTKDAEVRQYFNQYLLGMAIGVFPQLMGQQLAAFLSLENKKKRTTIAVIVFILLNLVLNYVFVVAMRLGSFGLALASSLGQWAFMLIQAEYFIRPGAMLKFSMSSVHIGDLPELIITGLAGAVSMGCQTIRGFAVNGIIETYVGAAGLSAFAAANLFMGFFWAVQAGMLSVCRMMISVSVGEEDRQTLKDIMKVMFTKFVPLISLISILIMVFAEPITQLYYRDPADPAYEMTVWGFRILPLCLAPAVIFTVFICYYETMKRRITVNVLSVIDGVICVTLFSWILTPVIGMNGVYIANVINGIITAGSIIPCSYMIIRKFPTTMAELLALPDSFGVPEDRRMDISLKSMEKVVTVSQKVEQFCLEHGIDKRRASLSGLAMEEMAGNVIDHGFEEDGKSHSVDIRVALKDDDVILRIKDDCVPFDPVEREDIVDPDDITKNIGIRMVHAISKKFEYQNILGLNVLTIRI